MPVTLLRIPYEVINKIAQFAIRGSPCITLTAFGPLHRSCHMFHAPSSFDAGSPPYSMLFVDKFDISSPRRHLSQDRLRYQDMEQEVKQRSIALQIIRRKDIWHPKLAEAFATIYVMLLEDDGRNWEQVLRADLPAFIPIFMRERLLEGASDNLGWLVDSELNTLAIALFWLISARGKCVLVLHELSPSMCHM